MKEIWKDIPDYEGLYQVSNLGNIKNIKRDTIKKLTSNRDGYYVTKLSNKNKKKVFLVHRLVAETFLNKQDYKRLASEKNINIEELTVNHKDENKQNNKVNNLEWCTNKYNILYSLDTIKNKKILIKKELTKYLAQNGIDEDIIEGILNIVF